MYCAMIAQWSRNSIAIVCGQCRWSGECKDDGLPHKGFEVKQRLTPGPGPSLFGGELEWPKFGPHLSERSPSIHLPLWSVRVNTLALSGCQIESSLPE